MFELGIQTCDRYNELPEGYFLLDMACGCLLWWVSASGDLGDPGASASRMPPRRSRMFELGIRTLRPVGRPWKPTTDALGSRIALTLTCGCRGQWQRVARITRWVFDPFCPTLRICRAHAHPKLSASGRQSGRQRQTPA